MGRKYLVFTSLREKLFKIKPFLQKLKGPKKLRVSILKNASINELLTLSSLVRSILKEDIPLNPTIIKKLKKIPNITSLAYFSSSKSFDPSQSRRTLIKNFKILHHFIIPLLKK